MNSLGLTILSAISIIAIIIFLILNQETQSKNSEPAGSVVTSSPELKPNVTDPVLFTPEGSKNAISSKEPDVKKDSQSHYKFPFLAKLTVKYKDYLAYEILGNIISDCWILTMYIDRLTSITITVGHSNPSGTKAYLMKYLYSAKTLHISLLETETMHFNDAVQPIELTDYDFFFYENSDTKLITIANAREAIRNGDPFQEREMRKCDFFQSENFICACPTDGVMSDDSTFGLPLVVKTSSGTPILVGISDFGEMENEVLKIRYSSISFLRAEIKKTTNI